MDTRTRYRLDVWVILILVSLNIGLLGLVWYDHHRKPPADTEPRLNPEEFFIRELALDAAQTDTVKALRRTHFAHTDSIKYQMVQLNMRMMKELFVASPDTALVRDLSEQIGRLQADFDRQVYLHFDQVKAVLRPDQYDRLDKLIFDALKKKQPSLQAANRNDQPPEGQEGERKDDRRPPPRDDRQPPPRDDRQPPPQDTRPGRR